MTYRLLDVENEEYDIHVLSPYTSFNVHSTSQSAILYLITIMIMHIVKMAKLRVRMSMNFDSRKSGCNDSQQKHRQNYCAFMGEDRRLGGHRLKQCHKAESISTIVFREQRRIITVNLSMAN